jgi:CHAD domain-containing protein
MDLELAVAAGAAAAIGRLKPLSATRDGRPRTQAIKLVCHDDPGHTLRAQGLTLIESRGTWRLERLYPGPETWLPAQPAPVLAEAPSHAELPDLPTPLAPLAAFEGKRTTSVHTLPSGNVTLTVDRGTLRAVTAERPAARLFLNGDPMAVREAALLLEATVPTQTLPAQAIALATGWTPPARRLGAPELPEQADTLTAALAHIMGHLLDVMLWHATRLDQGPEAVHQMRVAVRRARSALSLFRPGFAPQALLPFQAPLKTLNRQLGPARDWDVFTGETLPAIQAAMPDDERLQRLAAAADRRRAMHHKTLVTWLADPDFRLLAIDFAWCIASGTWDTPGNTLAEPAPAEEEPPPEPDALPPEAPISELDGFAAGTLRRHWKKLVSAGKGMDDMDLPSLHDVRLRAKRARYAAEMFATLFDGKGSSRFIKRLAILQQRLGELNDGVVATHLLAELGGPSGRHAYAAGLVAGFTGAHVVRLRPRIVSAFAKFRKQSPYWS